MMEMKALERIPLGILRSNFHLSFPAGRFDLGLFIHKVAQSKAICIRLVDMKCPLVVVIKA